MFMFRFIFAISVYFIIFMVNGLLMNFSGELSTIMASMVLIYVMLLYEFEDMKEEIQKIKGRKKK